VKATEVTAGPTESNGSLLSGLWRDSLHVTCGLTACTPGSAPDPTLGNEYGKTLPFLSRCFVVVKRVINSRKTKTGLEGASLKTVIVETSRANINVHFTPPTRCRQDATETVLSSRVEAV